MPAVANCRLMPSFPIGTSWGRPNASGRRAGSDPAADPIRLGVTHVAGGDIRPARFGNRLLGKHCGA